MNIIFVGPPGSGKGTQAEILGKKLGIVVISTGEILRKEIESKSKIGDFAKCYIDKGELVPDGAILEIVKSRITKKDCDNGFILDGFPRNIDQAVMLDEIVFGVNKEIDLVFNFEVEEEVLIKRILGRFLCKGCGAVYNRYFKPPIKVGICDFCSSIHFENRSDDTEIVIKNRLKVYNQSTSGLIEYYKKNNILVSINAAADPNTISGNLTEVILKFS